MNLNCLITHHVKHKVCFDNKNTVTEIFELFISWYSAEEGMISQFEDILVKFPYKRVGTCRIVICDPIRN